MEQSSSQFAVHKHHLQTNGYFGNLYTKLVKDKRSITEVTETYNAKCKTTHTHTEQYIYGWASTLLTGEQVGGRSYSSQQMQFDIEKRKKTKGMREKDGKRDRLRFSAVTDFCHSAC